MLLYVVSRILATLKRSHTPKRLYVDVFLTRAALQQVVLVAIMASYLPRGCRYDSPV